MPDIERLYQKYLAQSSRIPGSVIRDPKAFCGFVERELPEMECVTAEKDGNTGFLFYDIRVENEVTRVGVPVWGYCAESEKMMALLFQRLASQVVRQGRYEFSFRIYRDDAECVQALHMLQFGTMAEMGVCRIDPSGESGTNALELRVLGKTDLRVCWNEVRGAVAKIVSHLRESPVFYPGTEFTEDVYQEFFFDEGTEVLAAFHGDRLIGLIEWNTEREFLFGGDRSANVGEVYVEPEYRGSGLSDALFRLAEHRAFQAGYTHLWVEHGTANPNARSFWGRYFDTRQYELTRNIERRGF